MWFSFTVYALTMLTEQQEGHPACEKFCFDHSIRYSQQVFNTSLHRPDQPGIRNITKCGKYRWKL